jgi:Nineteen complex-related protein 2
LSKQVTESKGRKFGLQQSHVLPTTQTETPLSRPSYTKDYLSQLRDSTPSTPKDVSRYLSDSNPDSPDPIPTARPAEILDEAVVRALKERRRDRARGEDYLTLNPSDDDEKPSKRRTDSDDEDYRSYVDETVPLQRNMEAAQAKAKKAQIADALYRSDSEEGSDVDEDEWENLQISKAQGRSVKVMRRDVHAMPDVITAVLGYPAALARLKTQLSAMKARRGELVGTVEQLEKERDEIKEREEQVQEGLARAGREYEELREEFRGSGVNRGLDEVGDFGRGVNAMQV